MFRLQRKDLKLSSRTVFPHEPCEDLVQLVLEDGVVPNPVGYVVVMTGLPNPHHPLAPVGWVVTLEALGV